MPNKYVVYTDGGCVNNGQPSAKGGFGIVILNYQDGTHQTLRNHYPIKGVTNNQMEVLAVLKALEFIDKLESQAALIEVRTDSQLVIGWCVGGWKRRAETCIPLLTEIDILLQKHQVNFTWVRGHEKDRYNNLADKLAGLEIGL